MNAYCNAFATLPFQMCCSCATRVSQKHLIVKGFLSIFWEKMQKNQNFPFWNRFTSATSSSKIPWICYVCVALHCFLDCFVTLNVLHFIFSTLFLQCFSCISLYVYSLIRIFQSVTDFCVRFSAPLPSAALFWAAAGLWLYFLQQKTAQAAFSGPSVLCRIPYIKRRAAPKSRPPTIQAML